MVDCDIRTGRLQEGIIAVLLILMLSTVPAAALGTDLPSNATGSTGILEVSRIDLTPGVAEMAQGSMQRCIATAYDASDSAIPGMTFSWACSNESVGTVNETGYFTALAPGSAVISAGVPDSVVFGTADVTVTSSMPEPIMSTEIVTAEAHTWIVDASGGGDYTTIGAAVAAAGPSDTIIVRKGSYTENVVVNSPMIIHSESGPEETIVIPSVQNTPVFSLSASESTVAGLTIRGVIGGAALISLSGVSGCTIEDNIISTSKYGINMVDTRKNRILNNTLDTISEAGIDLKRAESDLLSGNTITSCKNGIQIYDSGNQYSYRVKIRDNTLTGCDYAIHLKYRMEGIEIINNTITAGKLGLMIEDGPTGNIIIGNTIQQQSTWNGIFMRNTYGNIIYLNMIQDNMEDIGWSSSSASWNSTEPITYIFDNVARTGYVGNYWDRYVGPDSDGDGIGDEPYVVFGTQMDYYPIVKTSNRIVTVTPGNVSLTAGDGLQFTAVLSDREGTEIPDAGFTWTSSDETVGTVNATGYFSALKAGTTTVGATNGGVSGTTRVTVQRAETPAGGVIPAVDDVHLRVANDAGVRFDDFGDNSFRILWSGGGLNALHISNGSGTVYGEVTETHDRTGTFYVTTTGGREYFDNIFLCVAMNETIPDDFRLHIRADGHQWTPLPIPRNIPTIENRTYIDPTVDEWFTKDDLCYGSQTWRPAAGTAYPIYPGQDVGDESSLFQLMFIDLKAGILPGYPLRVNYTIENLGTMAAFNVYAYAQSADTVNDYTTTWTNRLTGDPGAFSGWYVYGAPLPVADFKANITSGDAPLAVLFTDASTGNPTTWAWDFENDGIVDSTKQDPSHVYTTPGIYTVNLTVANAAGSNSEIKTDYITVTEPTGPSILPGYNNIFVKVANDLGVKYNAFDNNTYNIKFEGIDRGLNALHISTDPAVNFGQVTVTDSQIGTFYATDSGGKGYEDEIILMVAVNGTIPDNFRLRVSADGYTWTPNPERNQAPSLDNVTYQANSLDEVFTKEDFIYGPQIWKPTGNEADYPIHAGQDMTDAENTFQLMFIDLNAGVLRPSETLENRGAVRINYAFENLESFAAFSVYSYCKNPSNGDDMVAWTNALTSDKAMSGYSVTGVPAAPTANFTANVTAGPAPLAVRFADRSTGVIAEWHWDFENDGIVDSIEQNPIHTYMVPGNYTVNLTISTATGSATLSRPAYITATAPEGDLNGDGKVDIGDVSRVAYMVIGKEQEDLAADFNGNGKVDIGDAAKIACYFVGKIEAL